MSESLFLLQIVDAQHPDRVIRLPGGGPLEVDLIAVCRDAIVRRGVGLMAIVLAADGISESPSGGGGAPIIND